MADKSINFKMLIFIVLLVIIITGAASFTFFTYFSVSEGKENTEEKQSIEDIRPTYSVGDFVVNITDNPQINFVKASIVFEIENEKMIEELKKRKAQLRDKIISTLRSQNETILNEPGGETIKSIIKEKVNQLLISGQVKNVWFTELVVQ